MVYFYNTLGYASLEKNSNGTIKTIILDRNISNYKNFNKIIIDYFLNKQSNYNFLR